MLIANPRSFKWQHLAQDDWNGRWKYQGWGIVDAKWLATVEQQLRKSKLWKSEAPEDNETLGCAIAWFYEVRDEFERPAEEFK